MSSCFKEDSKFVHFFFLIQANLGISGTDNSPTQHSIHAGKYQSVQDKVNPQLGSVGTLNVKYGQATHFTATIAPKDPLPHPPPH